MEGVRGEPFEGAHARLRYRGAWSICWPLVTRWVRGWPLEFERSSLFVLDHETPAKPSEGDPYERVQPVEDGVGRVIDHGEIQGCGVKNAGGRPGDEGCRQGAALLNATGQERGIDSNVGEG